MEEKVLSTKKNGMLVLILSIAVYVLALIGVICGGILEEQGKNGTVLLVVSIIVLSLGWIIMAGT